MAAVSDLKAMCDGGDWIEHEEQEHEAMKVQQAYSDIDVTLRRRCPQHAPKRGSQEQEKHGER